MSWMTSLRYVLLLLVLSTKRYLCGYVLSWDIEYEENYLGSITSLKLFFSLESGLSNTSYISLVFPTATFAGTSPTSELRLYESQYLLVSGVVCTSTVNTYYCYFGTTLTAGTYY